MSAAGQRLGYNRVEVRRILGGATSYPNRFGWVVDGSSSATTFSGESLSSLSMTGSKYLSGVQYHTAGSATYDVTITNPYRNTYSPSASAVSHTGTRCTVASSAAPSAASADSQITVSKTVTVTTSPRILNQGLTVKTTMDRTVQSDATSTGVTSYSLLLDATAASSTAVIENMDDEVFRLPSNISTTTSSGYTSAGVSPSEWDSSISLVGATSGYSDGLLVSNSLLVYPTKGANSGNFAGISNGPASNANYSSASGNRSYLRFFYDSSPRQNFRLSFTVTSTSFVPVATGPSGNSLTVEVLAPSTTMDGQGAVVWKDAMVAYTSDTALGCYASTYGSTVPTSWGITLGGKNTATSGNVVLVRVTASSSWAGSISAIQLTWL